MREKSCIVSNDGLPIPSGNGTRKKINTFLFDVKTAFFTLLSSKQANK